MFTESQISSILYTDSQITAIAIAAVTLIFLVSINIYIIYRIYGLKKAKTKLNERINDSILEITERTSKISEVEYTEILSSNSNNESTKFLVVYKNGNREIVNTTDGSELCNLYLQLLKKE